MEETIHQGSERPTFLTVLCILTFIGSGWGLMSDGIATYFSADSVGAATEMVGESMDEAIDQIEENSEMSDSQKGFVESILNGVSENLTPEKIRASSLVTILSTLLTLCGAVLMWNLNKKGFYLYVAGILAGIVGMVVVFSGFIGIVAASGTAFIGLLFSILYGVNLKHMN